MTAPVTTTDSATGSATGSTSTGEPAAFDFSAYLEAARLKVEAALDGSLGQAEFRRDPNFGFDVPVEVPGVDAMLLDPRATWADKAAYDAQAAKLVKMFSENFGQYLPHIDADVKAAAIG